MWTVYGNSLGEPCPSSFQTTWMGSILIYDTDPMNTYYLGFPLNTQNSGYDVTESDFQNSYTVGVTNNTLNPLIYNYPIYTDFSGAGVCNGVCFSPYYSLPAGESANFSINQSTMGNFITPNNPCCVLYNTETTSTETITPLIFPSLVNQDFINK